MNDNDAIWAVVIVVVAFLFYKSQQTTAASNLAAAQIAAQEAASQANNPWLGVQAGVGAAGSILEDFSNLFSSND